MAHVARQSDSEEQPTAAASRSELARLMMRVCAEVGASRYMLAEPVSDRGRQSVRIFASNWTFDSIETIGLETVARLLDEGEITGPGTTPRPTGADMAFLTPQETNALQEYGHTELFCLRTQAAGRRFFLLLSSEWPGAIDVAALSRAHIKCCYAIGRLVSANPEQIGRDPPLTERERECLLWVSEGKTTDEVALILGVSSNTVNSYIAHAINKFGASNRAMAIATAIRNGII